MSAAPESAEDDLNAFGLIDQLFDLWITPHIEAAQLSLERHQVRKALLVMRPNQPVDVLLNDQADLTASFKARRDIAYGKPLVVDDMEELRDLRPAEVDPDAGWVAFAFVPGHGVLVSFDFRYNKAKATALLSLAGDYLATARLALNSQYLAPVLENAYAAAELAVTALTKLFAQEPRSRNPHRWRQHWLNNFTRLGNASESHYKTLRRLASLRTTTRYGEGSLPVLEEVELNGLLTDVELLITHALQRALNYGGLFSVSELFDLT